MMQGGEEPTVEEADAGPPPQWAAVPDEPAWRAFPIEAAPRLSLSGRLRGPAHAADNTVVLRIRFLAEDGRELDAQQPGLAWSASAGPYVYPQRLLSADPFTLHLSTPDGATVLECCLQLWRKAPPGAFEATELELRRLHEPVADAFDREVLSFGDRLARQFLSERPLALGDEGAPVTRAFLELVAAETRDEGTLTRYGRALLRAGRTTEALSVQARVSDPVLDRERGLVDLLGWARAQLAPAETPRRAGDAVVYLLHNALPYRSGGYAARAHGLLQGFAGAGRPVLPVIRPNFPLPTGEVAEPGVLTVEGLPYRYLRSPYNQYGADPTAYLQDYARAVLRELDGAAVGHVQAASFFHNAFAGRLIADTLGVPLVYEMRGLDWFTAGSQRPAYFDSEHGALMRDLELAAASCADRVLAITEALKAWLVGQGVPEAKIGVLPNGCRASSFAPVARERALAAELGLSDAFVVGYIGSVMFYEGVEFIAEAVAAARRLSGRDIRFLLVGDGPYLSEAMRRIEAAGVSAFVTATGRVPHGDIQRYYGLCDVIALGRRRLPVCEVISPLKPLEAMAMELPVLSTDVAAVVEMIEQSGGGLLAPADDVEGYAAALVRLAEQPELRRELGALALAWARGRRDWAVLARESLDDIAARFERV